MEIERKFVVNKDLYEKFLLTNNPVKYTKISQFYIPALNGTFRLRRSMSDKFEFIYTITLKKFVSSGVNEETEINIDSNTAYEILNSVKNIVGLTKIRRVHMIGDVKWEVDSFESGLSLVIAEVELDDINEDIYIPAFIEDEVTGNKDFNNENIAKKLATPSI